MNNTPSCETVHSLIASFDSLAEAERRILTRHVESCAACRARLEVIEHLGDHIMDEALAEIPPSLTDTIMQALEDARGRPTRTDLHESAAFWLALIIGGELVALVVLRSVSFALLSRMTVAALDARVDAVYILRQTASTLNLLCSMVGSWGRMLGRSLSLSQLLTALLVCVPLTAMAMKRGNNTERDWRWVK